jgi:hypothetical protein
MLSGKSAMLSKMGSLFLFKAPAGRADVVRSCGPAITSGLEGPQQMQGAGERADVVRPCGPAITAGLEGPPQTQGAGGAGVLAWSAALRSQPHWPPRSGGRRASRTRSAGGRHTEARRYDMVDIATAGLEAGSCTADARRRRRAILRSRDICIIYYMGIRGSPPGPRAG